MINSKILISVVIVLAIGVAAAGYQISQTPNLWELSDLQSQTPTQDGQSSTGSSDEVQGQTSDSQASSGSDQESTSGSGDNGGSNVQISSSKAKSIAEAEIDSTTGASAGTPELKTIDGKKVYYVSVNKNGKSEGYFIIDAKTGEIIEGAGGAP
ncbi:PepSY domain-containing protein [Methanobacterium alcaliphilum]|uniref:PepSY domain-containing protein n=1 Tax=Methanobacterium alcaliphilum TaxID=392018 RepID=UPI00200B33F4|nr:PepSY domain-containing protein [Methanobacterium alcaliphilum]MCK9150997.1 PepSY domain-containing protein [Methanobacterium alcaliphilum]